MAEQTAAPTAPHAEVERLSWYHTIDLPRGVTTPGFFDTRRTVEKVLLPGSLSGKRCLDVGTWDGFWAFELERRGAESVTAIDVDDPAAWDWPPHGRLAPPYRERLRMLAQQKAGGAAFRLAREALRSNVERVDLSVYDLSPERLGSFDFVFIGTLLMHLRDPVLALDRIRSVCQGELVVADAVDVIGSVLRPRVPTARLEGLVEPWWWVPSVAGLRRLVVSAGFEIVEQRGIYFLPFGSAHPPRLWRRPKGDLPSEGRHDWPFTRLWGLPHSALRARPVRTGSSRPSSL